MLNHTMPMGTSESYARITNGVRLGGAPLNHDACERESLTPVANSPAVGHVGLTGRRRIAGAPQKTRRLGFALPIRFLARK